MHSPSCLDRLASGLVADLGQHLDPVAATRHSSLLFEMYVLSLCSRAVIILINFIIFHSIIS